MLKEILKEVPDFRQKRGQSYELWAILALIIAGFLVPPPRAPIGSPDGPEFK